jgi:predicted SprT family Zn-dependent metalloprotease
MPLVPDRIGPSWNRAWLEPDESAVPYDSHLVQPPGTTPLSAAAHRRAALLLRRLAVLWKRPTVARVRVVVYPGLRRTLGRYARSTQQIELSPAVLSPKALTEVLTHEAAHAALATTRDQPIRPHGPEWRQLMTQAGQPDAQATRWCRRAKREAATTRSRSTQPKPPTTYDHRCPVCQATRPAKKPVPAWRCAACVAAGLQGRLEITPRAPRAPRPPQAHRPTQPQHAPAKP